MTYWSFPVGLSLDSSPNFVKIEMVTIILIIIGTNVIIVARTIASPANVLIFSLFFDVDISIIIVVIITIIIATCIELIAVAIIIRMASSTTIIARTVQT